METSFIAIAISIVIGVASNLLTPYVSKFLGNFFTSVKKRNEARKLVFENTVRYIVENPQEETNLQIRLWGRTIMALVVMMISVLLMFSDNPVQITSGFVFFVIGNFGNTQANKLGKILDEVGKRKKAKYPEIDLG